MNRTECNCTRLDDELHGLMARLADESARVAIECGCEGGRNGDGGRLWWNTANVDPEESEAVCDALRYMELRGDAFGYTVYRDGALMRFEERADASGARGELA